MNETIDSRVEGAKVPSKTGNFFGKAALYFVALGTGGGIGAICQQVYYEINGVQPVVMTAEEYRKFSNAVVYYDELCAQARLLRETFDKNHDGILSREEVGLPPKDDSSDE